MTKFYPLIISRLLIFSLLVFFGITVAAQPVISSFSPTAAAAGTTITITGNNFTGATSVSFGGINAVSFSVISPTSITAMVGSGASGLVNVVSASGQGSLAGFSFLPSPIINSFTPPSAASGSTITISGSGFNTTAANNTIFFGAVRGTVTASTATSLTAKLPISADYQPITVLNNANGLAGASPLSFLPVFNGGASPAVIAESAITNFSVGNSPDMVVMGDIDGDGKPDIVSSIYYGNSVYIFRNTSTAGSINAASFAAPIGLGTGNNPVKLVLSDLNGDGKPDIVVGNLNNFTIYIYQNTSTPGNISFAAPAIINNTGSTIAVADMDGDGRPDIIVADVNDIQIFQNTLNAGQAITTAGFVPSPGYSVIPLSIIALEARDLDNDGKPDLIGIANHTGTISVFRNTASPGILDASSLAPRVDFASGGNSAAIAFADIDGDGRTDIIVANNDSSNVTLLRNNTIRGAINASSFGSPVKFFTGYGAIAIAAGDLDGDGKADIAVTNYVAKTISVFRNTATPGSITSSSLATRVDFTAGYAPYFSSIDDLDGDGKPEIVVANFGDNTLSVLNTTLNHSKPLLQSFLPDTAGTGNTVTIKGRYLSEANSVTFGGIPATSFTTLSDSVITAVIGNGASGLVKVATILGIDSLSGFTYIPAPVISSFSPKEAGQGDTILIHGLHLASDTAVRFGGVPANSFTVISDTLVSAVVSSGASGKLSLSTLFGSTSADGFVFVPLPVISFFTPVVAGAGDTVSIHGKNFSTLLQVSFGEQSAQSFRLVSDTLIVARLGTGASGSVGVTTIGGTVSLAGFTYISIPVITSFSPLSGPVGTTVTITGRQFNQAPANNIVFFGAVRATVLSASATSLTVAVPAGANYRPISITVNRATAYSNLPFIVTYAGAADTSFNIHSFATEISIPTDQAPMSVSIGDIDGDGKADLVFPLQSGQFNGVAMSVIRNQSTPGNINMGARTAYMNSPSNSLLEIAVVDLDGDGRPDLATIDGSNVYPSPIYPNTSTGGILSFGPAMAFGTVGASGLHLAVGDLDGDGRPDIVLSSFNNSALFVYRNTSEGGVFSFAPYQEFQMPQYPGGIIISDLDGDGKADIAAVSINNMSFFRNLSTPGTIVLATRGDYPMPSGIIYGRNGLAVGDLNGDGKPDLAVGIGTSPIFSTYQNNSTPGTISFTQRTDHVTPENGGNIAIADLDGDGRPDITVINNLSRTVSVFKNTSTGTAITFSSGFQYAVEATPSGVSIGDIDGDGKAEIIVANEASSTVSILRNTTGDSLRPVINLFTPVSAGMGNTLTIRGSHFTGTTAISAGGTPVQSFAIISDSVATAVIGTGSSGSISLTTSYGTTQKDSFVYIAAKPVIKSFAPASGTIGDTIVINGNHFTNSINLSFGGIAPQSFGILSDSVIFAVLSTGASGNIVVTTTYGTDSISGFTYISSSGSFAVIKSFSPSVGGTGATISIKGKYFNGATTVAFGGINAASFVVLNDSTINAVVGAGASGAVSVQTPFGTAILAGFVFSNGLPAINSFSPVSGPVGSVVTINGAHFDPLPVNNIVFFGAVQAQVLTAASGKLTVTVPDGGTYEPLTVTVGGRVAYAVSPFIISMGGGALIDSNSFVHGADFVTGNYPYNTLLADVDGDGKTDIGVANFNGTSFSIFLNKGISDSIAFNSKIDIETPGSPNQIYAGDLDGDGKLDVVVVNNSTNNISIFKNTSSIGLVSFAPSINYATGSNPTNITIADVDNDGRPDIIATSFFTITIFRNITVGGALAFAPGINITEAKSPYSISLRDFDQDGYPDILVAHPDSTVSVFRNITSDSTIAFAPPLDVQTGQYSILAFAGDIDGDGKPDLVSGNKNDNTASVLRNTSTRGAISFAPRINFPTGVGPEGIYLTDVDGDGRPDILFADRNANSVTVLQNTSQPGAVSFASKVDFATGSQPNSIRSADVDGDGKPEIIVTIGNGSSGTTLTVLKNKVPSTPLPQITYITPDTATSGVTVIIHGSHFTGTTAVAFGGTPANSFTVVSDSVLLSILGPGTSGNVIVTTAAGTGILPGFVFLASKPVISNVSPDSAASGNTVTITGAHLTGTTQVSFGGTPANSFNVVSDSVITAVVDSGSSGNVIVITGGGADTLAGFVYLPGNTGTPNITGFSPSIGTTGTVVTIHGTGLTGVESVSFGGVPASSFTIQSDTVIIATVGTGASGDVVISGPSGTASMAGFTFIQGQQQDTTFQLISFGGHFLSNGQVMLNWLTLNDQAIQQYTIRRSTDSIRFDIIGNVNSLGGAANTYSFTDSLPPATKLYYELIATDTSSGVVLITIISIDKTKPFAVFPNPAPGYINVQFPNSISNSSIRIVDLSGRVARSVAILPGSNQVRISLTGIESGVYQLQWTDGKNKVTKTILVQ